MQQALPWFTALGVLVVIAASLAFWATRPRQSTALPLPNEWAVTPRAIFSVDERRAYRHLRDAFPQHLVLAKLPLIRLCQPADPKEMRYWFELLGSIHVSYAICTPQGRVLAALDLDGERPASRRTQQVKQGVLSTCRIRYLRCTIEHLPSNEELQRLVLPTGYAATAPAAVSDSLPEPVRGPQRPAEPTKANIPAPAAVLARDDLVSEDPGTPSGFFPDVTSTRQAPVKTSPAPAPPPVREARSADAKTRKERKPLWQDSGLFQDSFFGIDNLRDAGPPSNFGSLLAESARGRNTTSNPQISADPTQGMLESERAKLKQQGQR